jgi:hypothetical protein
MKIKKIESIWILSLAVTLLMAGLAKAAATDPSAPTSYTSLVNHTSSYPNGTQLNGTRGFIYDTNLTESQPSQKWVGYVGHINGEYALQDASGDALYDWDIVTVTGEVYATKEGYDSGTPSEATDPFAGGMPDWTSLQCANKTMIDRETWLFNHSHTEEDRYNATFTRGTSFHNPGFYAGTNIIIDSDVITESGTCYGAHLNYNNTDNDGSVATVNWTQVVLTDGSSQDADGVPSYHVYDLVYAALIQNDSWGYDNRTYDFQILLPQSGLQGDQPRVAFYFYLELI